MLEKKKFVRYKLDSEKAKEKRKILAVSLNKQEEIWLKELKKDLDIKSDGRALKVGAFVCKNVLHSVFGKKILRYLFKKERATYEED